MLKLWSSDNPTLQNEDWLTRIKTDTVRREIAIENAKKPNKSGYMREKDVSDWYYYYYYLTIQYYTKWWILEYEIITICKPIWIESWRQPVNIENKNWRQHGKWTQRIEKKRKKCANTCGWLSIMTEWLAIQMANVSDMLDRFHQRRRFSEIVLG